MCSSQLSRPMIDLHSFICVNESCEIHFQYKHMGPLIKSKIPTSNDRHNKYSNTSHFVTKYLS